MHPREYDRAWLTFLFGLVHGFGFASALAEVELPPVRLPGDAGLSKTVSARHTSEAKLSGFPPAAQR